MSKATGLPDGWLSCTVQVLVLNCRPRPRWARLPLVTALAAFSLGFYASPGRAQSPSVGTLSIVALDTANDFTAREPAVAVANANLAMCAYNDSGLHLSLWNGTIWVQQSYTHSGGDPSIVFDATKNQCVVCTFVGGSSGGINLDRYDVASGAFLPVQTIVGGGTDKPWIVLGETQVANQELYLVYKEAGSGGAGSGTPKYGRSTDSGQNWITGTGLGGGFCTQATVVPAGISPIFIAYPGSGSGGFSLAEGTDSAGGGVTFAPLLDAASQIIVVPAPHANGSVDGEIPGPSSAKLVPYVVADPSNSDRVYLVYFDNLVGPSQDIDVWCARLDRTPTTGIWSISQIKRVNDDPLVPGDDRDQFQPAAVVDSVGRVHVVFYDDRRFEQLDQTGLTAKFDAYYAYSTDGGTTFTNIRINRNLGEPIMDCAILNETFPNLMPGEYPGIAVKDNVVMVTMAGTWSQSPNTKKSVIWGCTITF